ncbi:MAG: SDR family NAD(P)-dependent oxidoreductase [Sphingobium sp.]
MSFTFDLSGRTVLVTGASGGLGARFATILAASGANIVLTARRTALLEGVRERIEAMGGKAIAVAMDAADEASTIAAYDAAEAAFGPVDSVIANAGITIDGLALDLEADAFDKVFAVNVRGVFLTAREGARRMLTAGSKERRHGRVVIISSVTSDIVVAGLSPYAASKAAVLQMGRVLAREWANRGVNVNILSPGYIETDINADWFATDGGKRQIAQWPRRRLMDASALDATLLFLASDASAYVTASNITIDDGQSLSG